MRSTLLNLLGLIILLIANFISVKVFKIRNNKFYAPFHFLGGLLTMFLFLSLVGRILVALSLTILVGILWEITEWLWWKIVIKKQEYKPGGRDTMNDLILDFLGGITAIIFWLF
mgnify:FL=1